MSLKVGIVGLPNVGKSTLFNALTNSRGAQAANYPFCTIEPNVGIVEVRDERLEKLREAVHGEKIVPATVEFVDIAGLVRGASQGEGLGNKFLAHIRECDAILEVVRVFDEGGVTHVENSLDPKRDIEIIHAELIFADLDTVSRAIGQFEKKTASGDKEAKLAFDALKAVEQALLEGKLANSVSLDADKEAILKKYFLLTKKPFLYAANVSDNMIKNASQTMLSEKLGLPADAPIFPISAKLEEDLMELTAEEKTMFLDDLGVQETGMDALIKVAFSTLGLMYYFTAGEKEVRAWTIHKGYTAPQAAGEIHTDFEKGFIKADVVNWQDLVSCGGWAKAREVGKVRLEGKDYIVQDGDVMLFKFNV